MRNSHKRGLSRVPSTEVRILRLCLLHTLKMAGQPAAITRQDHLSSLGLQFPLWVFEADDPRWPRRLDSLLPTSHPAKLTGWTVSFSEYAQHLTPLQDLQYSKSESDAVPPMTRNQRADLAQSALTQLRYDDRYDLDSLQVVLGTSGEQSTRRLSSWVFDKTENEWINPAGVQRIERIWDNVPLFDPSRGITQLSDFNSAADACVGIATLVANDDELVFASGILATDGGEDIRKAEFERLYDDGGIVHGIVCSSRAREPGDHGLMLNLGPKDKYNIRLLAGTSLQYAPWEKVVEYRKGIRPGPLW